MRRHGVWLCILFLTMRILARSVGAQEMSEIIKSAPIKSDEELAELVAQLNQPKTHFKALSTLVHFSLLKPWCMPSMTCLSGDAKFDDLEDKTRELLTSWINPGTIAELMDSSDNELRRWALLVFKTPLNQAKPFPAAEEWLAMVPKVELLAVEGDVSVRDQAVFVLAQCPGTREFLDQRALVEQSASVLRFLLTGRTKEERDARFNARLADLLKSADPEVRLEALSFVAGDHFHGPDSQTQFDARVLDAILPLTRSESEKERAEATYAVAMIRSIDPVRSHAAIVELARDPSGLVRRWIAFGLTDAPGSPETLAIVSALLADPVPQVRYMTTIALGPEKFVKTLQQLTTCDDPETAKNAASTLKGLAQRESREKR